MRIILTGGGTGGHIIPLITVAQKIKEKVSDVEFVFIGPGGKMEKDLLGKAGIPVRGILVGKMRRYFSFWNFVDFFKIPIGFLQSLALLLWYMPDAVFSKGGYASFPVVLVSWIYRIPVLIHESDANPGMANSMMSKFANRVAISYSEAEKYFPAVQVVLTGNPVRSDIAEGNASKAREMFGLLESKKVIFVLGGSQGARNINNKILDILPDLLHKYQIIHQTGENNFEEVARKAGELGIKPGREGYHAITFYGEEIKDILAVSDLVISRAGANSLAEIAATKKPSIIIPLASAANNHQRMNAYYIAKTGACMVLEESNLGSHMLLSKIEEVMNDEALRMKMSQNIGVFYHPDAADKIAEGVIGMIDK
ncbi:MAG TPA: undecaprenyldiphospho-muramoylpentapeptide beta-N-acetylglucosaminyltransferase [Candidatus Moranbacteria bacterium]|nr:undecaprenyldiphospho-muramoylpentapeptide beta-N-acetylglucosaminyltransferase [Candidatus Moranbacteria bacterium]